MAFFVIGRGRSDGVLRLLGSAVHETREDAVRSVQMLASSGTVSVDDVDVYIADLASAAPVMIVGVPAPVPSEAVAAGAWEAPEPAVVHELPTPDPGDVLLADALQRAATHLESEGIVPPASVGFESDLLEDDAPEDVGAIPELSEEPLEDLPEVVDAPEPDDSEPLAAELEEPAPDTTTVSEDLTAVIASLGSLTGEPEAAAEEESATVEEWPWVNVADVPVVDVIAEEDPVEEVATPEPEPLDVAQALVHPEPAWPVDPEPVAEPEPVVIEEPPVTPPVFKDTDTLIVAPHFEDFTPQPIIMGDYADDVSPEAAAPEAALEPDPEIGAAVAAAVDVSSLAEVAAPAAVYEPAGDLALEAYTCADCVYSNTCPKVNQVTPSECGAFQWKAI